MQGMLSCKKKPPFLDLLRSMSAQHVETYKATSSWHSVWTMIAHVAMEFRLIFLALFDMEACTEVRCVSMGGGHGKV